MKAATRRIQPAQALLSVLPLALVVACKPVEVIDAPDAGLRECKKGAYAFCDAAAPGVPACARQDPAYKRLSELGPGPGLPTGCTVNFVDGKDVNGECKLDALCRCREPDEAGATAWSCFP